MKPGSAAALGLLVLSTLLAGCFGGARQDDVAPAAAPPPEIDVTQQRRLEILAAPEVRNYSLPGSARLAPQVKWFNGTIGPEANTAYQDRNMNGGNDYRTVLQTFPVEDLVPAGQPTALRVTLVYFGQPGSAAKAHIYVCVPAHCTYYTRNNNDQFNWKVTVEIVNVVTVGVPGEEHLVGVAASDGLITEPLEFSLKVEASYFADVLTPFYAYAFTVPEGATGVTLRSVKPGQEHLQSKFVILDPQDNLVTYVEYDDIAIPTESIFVPTRQPGEYVFYAQEMRHGFFAIESDAPLGNDTALRALPVQETRAALPGGLAPGVPERDPLGSYNPGGAVPPTPYNPGSEVKFSVEQGFPVEVGAYVGPGFTGALEIRILSSQGEVYRFQRAARYDSDQGSLGYTRDEANTHADWSKLAKGSYTVSFVNDGETGEFGYWYRTYQR